MDRGTRALPVRLIVRTVVREFFDPFLVIMKLLRSDRLLELHRVVIGPARIDRETGDQNDHLGPDEIRHELLHKIANTHNTNARKLHYLEIEVSEIRESINSLRRDLSRYSPSSKEVSETSIELALRKANVLEVIRILEQFRVDYDALPKIADQRKHHSEDM